MDNRLVLTGRVVKLSDTQRSPAGLPIARFVLDHRSLQQEAGFSREARCRLSVLAAGEQLAPAVAKLSVGVAVKVSGFISRANNRQGEYRLILHAEHIELVAV